MGFSRDELESFRDAEIDDLVGPGLRLLFVGVNPGLWTAATGTPFAHPGNRFFPALVQAGILTERPGFARGLNEAERERIVGAGIGITNLVRRATARAAELSRDELRAGVTADDVVLVRRPEGRPSADRRDDPRHRRRARDPRGPGDARRPGVALALDIEEHA